MPSNVMFKTGPKFINLKGPGGTGSMNDLEFQQREAQRMQQLAMADAIRKQSMDFGGTEMIGQHAVEKSPWEILGKLGSGFVASQDQKFLNQQGVDNQKARQEGLSKALSEYMGLREGAPGGDPLAGPTPDGKPLATLPIPGDPRKAAMGAATSGYKELQTLGQADLAAQAKAAAEALKARMDPAESLKLMFPAATPSSQQAMLADLAAGRDPRASFVAKQEIGQIDPGKPVIDKNTFGANGAPPVNPFMAPPGGQTPAAPGTPAAATQGGMAGLVDFQPKKPTHETINGDLYEVNPYDGTKKKLDNAPKISLSNIGNVAAAGNKKFAEKIGDVEATEFGAQKKEANSAVKVLQELPDLRARLAADAPMITGFGADTITKAYGLARKLGMNVSMETLKNSQTFDSSVNNILAGYMASLGARGLTDKDMQVLKDAMVNRNMEPEAMIQAIDMIQGRNESILNNFTQIESAYRSQLGDEYVPLQRPGPAQAQRRPDTPAATVPPPAAPGASKRIDFSQISKGK